MNRDQERRTKQKLDHAGQSGSPQGGRRNFKRIAQRDRPQSISGTSQGHPCNYSAPHRTADDGNDGYWSFEHALTPEFNPETGECQINAREKYLRKHGRRILPAVCAKTPPRIPTPFGQHQVESDTYPQLHAPRFNIGYTPRLSKNYAK